MQAPHRAALHAFLRYNQEIEWVVHIIKKSVHDSFYSPYDEASLMCRVLNSFCPFALSSTYCAEHSPAKIIRVFGYPISTVYDAVAKCNAYEKSEEGSANPARRTHSREHLSRTSGTKRERLVCLNLNAAPCRFCSLMYPRCVFGIWCKIVQKKVNKPLDDLII